jgi:hypothetical protein
MNETAHAPERRNSHRRLPRASVRAYLRLARIMHTLGQEPLVE